MSATVQSYEKRREKVKAELLKRQEAERNTLSVIMSLMDTEVSESHLIESASKLTPSHYKDVTEERGLTLVCGYPVCQNRLNPLNHKQKYHISARSNKVYDITERKYFCSSRCYKASKYLEGQLSEEPLWGRYGTTDIQLHSMTEDNADVAVNDDSVIIDKHTSHTDSADITEVLAADILQKLKLEGDEEVQGTNLLSEDEISDGEDSAAEDVNEMMKNFFEKRRSQRLNPNSSDTHVDTPTSDPQANKHWQGSMLNRLKTAATDDEVSAKTTSANNESTPVLSANESSSIISSANKNSPITLSANEHKPTNTLGQRSTNKNDSVIFKKVSHKTYPANRIKRKQVPAAKTVLLDCTMPVPKAHLPRARAYAEQTTPYNSLKAALDRLTQWFSPDTRRLLFIPFTRSPAAGSSAAAVEDEAGSSDKPGSSSADTEVEISPPHVQTVCTQQRGIVYQRVLKCYGQLMSALPEQINFKDELGAIVKTLRLDKDNIACKPLEWNIISLILSICVCEGHADSTQGAANELVRLTKDDGCLHSVQDFIRHQKQLLT